MIPLYLSTFNLSRYWLDEFLGIVFVIYSKRSAKVDLPWSMWAIMQKFRILSFGKYYENFDRSILVTADLYIIYISMVFFLLKLTIWTFILANFNVIKVEDNGHIN